MWPLRREAGQNGGLGGKAGLGGTCLNGAASTKALLHSARLYHAVKEAEGLGIHVEGLPSTMKMARRKDSVVQKLRQGIAGLMKGNRIAVFPAEGGCWTPIP